MPTWQNNTPEDLEVLSAAVLSQAPCALEMPAGTGKTHLLAKSVAIAAKDDLRSLILTHTNAGVDALKKRLSKMGVPPSSYKVDTITGFAFSLTRAYEDISGVTVPSTPDWTHSPDYIAGANRVANARAIQHMLEQSYDYFFIDEYQDCSTDHHEFILSVLASIPKTIVLGDRLQGIFGFRDVTLVDWDDVLNTFPLLSVDHTPHRWRDVNPALGQWLQDIRPLMHDGSTIDLSQVSVTGFEWLRSGDGVLGDRAFSFEDPNETVLLLDKWDRDVARHASMLGGRYLVMEDVRGRFMVEELATLPSATSPELAHWLAQFAKKCMVGLAGVDAVILGKLQQNLPIAHYHREGIQDIQRGLEELRMQPSYAKLLETADSIAKHTGTKLYRWEGWRDTLSAIRLSNEGETSPTDELAMIRDKLRHAGRRPHARVASRTVLVKGLEYDHVIIANVSNLLDPKNLYVALTRAKKTISVISSSPLIRLVDDQ